MYIYIYINNDYSVQNDKVTAQALYKKEYRD